MEDLNKVYPEHTPHRQGFVEAVKKAAAICEARSQKLDAGGAVAATLRKQIANLINEYDHAQKE